jgi:hypothetical protein
MNTHAVVAANVSIFLARTSTVSASENKLLNASITPSLACVLFTQYSASIAIVGISEASTVLATLAIETSSLSL